MKNESQQRSFWRDTARPLIVMCVVMFSFRSALADWNDVPTGSMKPTIVEGDRVVVNKLAYDLKVPFTLHRIARWDAPARGDIVVFFSPHDGTRLVKRVIGLPGDRIEMREKVLFVNGAAASVAAGRAESRAAVVAEEQLGAVAHSVRLLADDVGSITAFGPLTVPRREYFVMGDNRDESFDSRYFGPVPEDQIVGRATAVAFSLDRERYFVPRLDRVAEKLR